MMGSWQVSAILELEVRPPDIVPGLEIFGDSWRDLFIHAALKYAIYIGICPFLIRKWILFKPVISSWNLGFRHSGIGRELIYLKALGPGFSHPAATGIAGAQKKYLPSVGHTFLNAPFSNWPMKNRNANLPPCPPLSQ